MTLPEAIGIATHLSTAGAPKITLDEIDAIKLLIEAGKRLSKARQQYSGWSARPLPGETET